jgi:perosamine synthetase
VACQVPGISIIPVAQSYTMLTDTLRRSLIAPARTIRRHRLVGGLERLARHQAQNLKRLVKGKPVRLVGHGSMTLDRDDIRLARHWLARPQDWDNVAPIRAFEDAFRDFNRSGHAVAFSAGRAALYACLDALDIGSDDEVILPGYTCVVVPNALTYRGIRPIYADIELDTYGLDAAQLPKLVTRRTRAILLHHLYGLVCRDYEAIVAFARQRSIHVIEDCAHSTGATFRGQPVGNLGDVAFFSSEQSKTFNTVMGGVAVCNDGALGERLRSAQSRAGFQPPALTQQLLENVSLLYYSAKCPHRWLTADMVQLFHSGRRYQSTTHDEELGRKPTAYGAAMAPPIAALGLNQLAKLPSYNERRRATATDWNAWIDARGLKRPYVLPDSEPVFLRYPTLADPAQKENPVWAADELGVVLGVWFKTHVHPVARKVDNCPNATLAGVRPRHDVVLRSMLQPSVIA